MLGIKLVNIVLSRYLQAMNLSILFILNFVTIYPHSRMVNTYLIDTLKNI